ncbi:hypothetical protein EJ03DRAFT_351439 [Teratosphaeria nubilosa]|uniref:Uncharacterized protein n=1 Tax=Teratosphaeria nubilosa TaxID=161662 RepID=A0A6G1L8N1_9PEZI|nr:hypothetical protein EJ03DRAFT_351439 [Teratosphaeria nubilosa]
MKVHKPNPDQTVEFQVLANGMPCAEYLVSERNTGSNIVECFIPVAKGDQLTLFGTFSGSCLHAAFDVLADGTFVADEESKGQEAGRTSVFASDRVVEGDLHVRTLREDISGYGIWKGDLGVGSLAVIVSLSQDPREGYHEKYASKTVGAWATGCADELEDGGIAPEFELEHKVTNEDVSKTRQTKHRRHFEQTRFGKHPWVKLVFHYRSKEAIARAGCKTDVGEAHALEPLVDPQSFVRGSMETKKALKQKSGTVRDHSRPAATTASRESSAGIFLSPEPPGPPAALIKKKLFGRPLLKGPEDNSEPHYIEAEIRSKYEDSFRNMSEQGSGAAKAADEDIEEVFPEAGRSPLTSGHLLEHQAPAATMTTTPPFASGGGGIGSDEHEDAFSRASSVIVNEHDSTSVPAKAEARVKQEEGLQGNPDANRENDTHDNLCVTSNSTGGEHAVQQSKTTTDAITEERAQNGSSKMSEIKTLFPDPVPSPETVSINVKGRSITAEDVGRHIHTTGSTLLDLASALGIREEFDHNRDLNRQFVKLVQTVGYRKATDPNTYYLKPRTTSPQPAAPPSQEQQPSPEGIS